MPQDQNNLAETVPEIHAALPESSGMNSDMRPPVLGVLRTLHWLGFQDNPIVTVHKRVTGDDMSLHESCFWQAANFG